VPISARMSLRLTGPHRRFQSPSVIPTPHRPKSRSAASAITASNRPANELVTNAG
jgi:hypothetical protein